MEKNVSAVLLAVFNEYEAADRVRVNLVRDGFPTDRLDLTAACDLGRAGCQPGELQRTKCVQYFRTMFKSDADRPFVEGLAERVDAGAAIITVHPRGSIEINRARQILELASPLEIRHRELHSRTFGGAAARTSRPWISHLWVEGLAEAHCFYCWLFDAT
jgi:hypothetical protein